MANGPHYPAHRMGPTRVQVCRSRIQLDWCMRKWSPRQPPCQSGRRPGRRSRSVRPDGGSTIKGSTTIIITFCTRYEDLKRSALLSSPYGSHQDLSLPESVFGSPESVPERFDDHVLDYNNNHVLYEVRGSKTVRTTQLTLWVAPGFKFAGVSLRKPGVSLRKPGVSSRKPGVSPRKPGVGPWKPGVSPWKSGVIAHGVTWADVATSVGSSTVWLI